MSLKQDLKSFENRFGRCKLFDAILDYRKTPPYSTEDHKAFHRIIDRLDEIYSNNLAWRDIKTAYKLKGTYKNI